MSTSEASLFETAIVVPSFRLPLPWRTARAVVTLLLGLALLLSLGHPAEAALPEVKIPSRQGFVEVQILGEVSQGTVLQVEDLVYVREANSWRKVVAVGGARTALAGESLIVVNNSADDAVTVKVYSLAGQLRQESTVSGRFEYVGSSGFIVSGDRSDSYFVAFGSATRARLAIEDYADDWRLGDGWALARVDGSWQALSLADGASRPIEIPTGADPAFAGTAVVYAAYDADAKRARLCRSTDPSAAFVCRSADVDAGSANDYVSVRTFAGQSTPSVIIENEDTRAQYWVRYSGSATRVSGWGDWVDTPLGPESYAVRDDKGSVVRLGDDGATTVISVTPQGRMAVRLMSLSPNVVAGGHAGRNDQYATIWKRSLSGGSLGPENLLPGRATDIRLSGSRMAISTALSVNLW